MWTAGVRYAGIKSLKELDLLEQAMFVLNNSLSTAKTNLVSIKSDYIQHKRTEKSDVVLDNNFI